MERVVSDDGTPVAYERLGSGPSIVLVHAGFVDRRIWLPAAGILAERFTVVLTDRRGRVESGPTEGITSSSESSRTSPQLCVAFSRR